MGIIPVLYTVNVYTAFKVNHVFKSCNLLKMFPTVSQAVLTKIREVISSSYSRYSIRCCKSSSRKETKPLHHCSSAIMNRTHYESSTPCHLSQVFRCSIDIARNYLTICDVVPSYYLIYLPTTVRWLRRALVVRPETKNRLERGTFLKWC